MNKPVLKGSVVKYKEGYYRVSFLSVKRGIANLTGIFTSYIHHRAVPASELVEAHDEWYEHWTQSETYKSM